MSSTHDAHMTTHKIAGNEHINEINRENLDKQSLPEKFVDRTKDSIEAGKEKLAGAYDAAKDKVESWSEKHQHDQGDRDIDPNRRAQDPNKLREQELQGEKMMDKNLHQESQEGQGLMAKLADKTKGVFESLTGKSHTGLEHNSAQFPRDQNMTDEERVVSEDQNEQQRRLPRDPGLRETPELKGDEDISGGLEQRRAIQQPHGERHEQHQGLASKLTGAFEAAKEKVQSLAGPSLTGSQPRNEHLASEERSSAHDQHRPLQRDPGLREAPELKGDEDISGGLEQGRAIQQPHGERQEQHQGFGAKLTGAFEAAKEKVQSLAGPSLTGSQPRNEHLSSEERSSVNDQQRSDLTEEQRNEQQEKHWHGDEVNRESHEHEGITSKVAGVFGAAKEKVQSLTGMHESQLPSANKQEDINRERNFAPEKEPQSKQDYTAQEYGWTGNDPATRRQYDGAQPIDQPEAGPLSAENYKGQKYDNVLPKPGDSGIRRKPDEDIHIAVKHGSSHQVHPGDKGPGPLDVPPQ